MTHEECQKAMEEGTWCVWQVVAGDAELVEILWCAGKRWRVAAVDGWYLSSSANLRLATPQELLVME